MVSWDGIGGFFPVQAGAILAALIGQLSMLGSRSLARHRELAADRGAVALTGRPASLSAALTRISGRLALIPTEDLRAAATRDAFNLLPAGDVPDGLRGTHLRDAPVAGGPPRRLERFEHALHAGASPTPATARRRSGRLPYHGPSPRSGWSARGIPGALMKTYVATPTSASATGSSSTPNGQTLGRLATQIADALRGKSKPSTRRMSTRATSSSSSTPRRSR